MGYFVWGNKMVLVGRGVVVGRCGGGTRVETPNWASLQTQRQCKSQRQNVMKRQNKPPPHPKKNNHHISPDYAMIQMTICI